MNNVILFANWGLGNLVLQKLLNNNVNVIAVVSQYDEGNKDEYFNLVTSTAKKNGIKVYENWQDLPIEIINQVDYGLSISYNKIFKKSILTKLPIINFHPALLPDYRGPSPILWQIKEKKEKIGATLHLIDEKIDTGNIIAQSTFQVSFDLPYPNFIDNLNELFAEWILKIISTDNFFKKNRKQINKKKYYHKINIKKPLFYKPVKTISEVLNRKSITIFTGNRAEFGIITPLLIELSKLYNVNLILSGAHVVKPWETKKEVYSLVEKKDLNINIFEVENNKLKNHYRDSMLINFKWGFDFFEKQNKAIPQELCIVIGDRVESYAFANSAFFNNVPICHLFGGDVANVPYFDTNIRHAITKISSLHLVSNRQSLNNVIRMGEEKWRTELIGNISLDNYAQGNTSSKESLTNKYELKDETTIILTYHPSQYVDEKTNFEIFHKVYSACVNTGLQMIVTYPNNDEGHQLITQFLENQPRNKNKIIIRKNLGMKDYLGVLKEFNCIMVGNSSSGLYETAITGTPTINIGDRQVDRPRAKNVIDLSFAELDKLKDIILEIKNNYKKIKKENLKDQYFFGDGHSVERALNKIKSFIALPLATRINKKFEQNE